MKHLSKKAIDKYCRNKTNCQTGKQNPQTPPIVKILGRCQLNQKDDQKEAEEQVEHCHPDQARYMFNRKNKVCRLASFINRNAYE